MVLITEVVGAISGMIVSDEPPELPGSWFHFVTVPE